MHRQQQDNVGVPENRTDLQMLEAALQAPLQIESFQQRGQHDQAGKGGELLILESDLRKRSCFQFDRRFANLHTNGLSCWFGCLQKLNHTNAEAVFIFVNRIFASSQISPRVTFGKSDKSWTGTGNTSTSVSMTRFLCN